MVGMKEAGAAQREAVKVALYTEESENWIKNVSIYHCLKHQALVE